MMRLRRGKFVGSGGVPGGKLADQQTPGGDLLGQFAVARRIGFVEAGAPDRDGVCHRP